MGRNGNTAKEVYNFTKNPKPCSSLKIGVKSVEFLHKAPSIRIFLSSVSGQKNVFQHFPQADRKQYLLFLKKCATNLEEKKQTL